MKFIAEATGIKNDSKVWENIPVDTAVEPSQEFIELFKKNASTFEFYSKASRRTVIDLFLREITSQFPEFIIICQYHMSMTNQVKKRRLHGNCDYIFCHSDRKELTRLVAIEGKSKNKNTRVQYVGECASIYYKRKEDKMNSNRVYGIHSTGETWRILFIDENGSWFETRQYELYLRSYNKEAFYLVYRLVYFVVKQSYENSLGTTNAGSLINGELTFLFLKIYFINNKWRTYFLIIISS